MSIADIVTDFGIQSFDRDSLQNLIQEAIESSNFLLGTEHVLLQFNEYSKLKEIRRIMRQEKSGSISRPMSFSDDDFQIFLHSQSEITQELPNGSFLNIETQKSAQASTVQASPLKLAPVNYYKDTQSDDEPQNKLYPIAETVIMSSAHQFEEFFRLTTDFTKLNYQDQLPEIIKIQSIWRGIKQRCQYKIQRLQHRAAILIQSNWKRWIIQKAYLQVLPIHRTVLKIQKWWKSVRARRRMKLLWAISKSQSTLEKTSYLLSNSHQKSKVMPDTSGMFIPTISSYSKELAINKEIREGQHHIPVGNRLYLRELQRRDRIEEQQKERAASLKAQQRQPRRLTQNRSYSNIQSRHRLRQRSRANFYESQEETVSISTISQPKCDVQQTVDRLYNWARNKQEQLQKARQTLDYITNQPPPPYRMSSQSQKYLARRKRREQQSLGKEQEAVYWPVES